VQHEDIVQMLLCGDPRGAEEFLRRCGPLIRYVIAPILQDPQDREDCLQEVTVQVWEKIAQYDPEKGSFTAWLTAVTRNAARNRARRREREEPLQEEQTAAGSTPEEDLLRRERQRELNEALQKLTQREQLLFYRKYYYCQSTAQIAAELGMTERAVEGRLYRIKKLLRRWLGGDDRG